MSIDEIKDRLAQIKQLAEFDDERAHEEEDDLLHEFVMYVCLNPKDPELQAKAVLVVSVRDIHFSRWCS